MKLTRFRERSLIMGSFLSTLAIQNWLRTRMTGREKVSFLGCLILVALHFENEAEAAGPSRLAHSLGFSRSRVSQEISSLETAGYIKRGLVVGNARAIRVSLTQSGERLAVDLIKGFSKLQDLIDKTVGERQAESINAGLIKIAEALS